MLKISVLKNVNLIKLKLLCLFFIYFAKIKILFFSRQISLGINAFYTCLIAFFISSFLFMDKELDFNKTHKLFATLKHEKQVLNDIAFERLPEPERKQYKDFL